ncbi:MAG: hypothetical protein IJV29_12220 [Butyrivibrio sp.]|nr:hypothetical protein [Butyrivibrio sp.]
MSNGSLIRLPFEIMSLTADVAEAGVDVIKSTASEAKAALPFLKGGAQDVVHLGVNYLIRGSIAQRRFVREDDHDLGAYIAENKEIFDSFK